MPADLKDIANRSFKATSPKERMTARQQSEAAALAELEQERDAKRSRTERLRSERLAAETELAKQPVLAKRPRRKRLS